MEYLVSALWIFLEVQYIFLFFSSFLKKKRNPKEYSLTLCFLWILIYVETNISFLESVYPLLTNALLFAGSYFLFYGKWHIRIFLQIAIILFSSIMDTLVVYGAGLLLNISLNEFIWMNVAYSIACTAGKLLLLFLVWILYRFRTSQHFNELQGKWFLLTILFPLVSFVMLSFSYYNNRGNEEASFGVLLMSIVLAVANMGILYLIHVLEKTTAQEQEMALLKQQMDYQKENFSALERNYRSQRKATHEFERHIQVLGDLIEREEYETAVNYVSQLQKNRTLRVFTINSKHPVVDVILNQKYQLARDNEISMQIKINDLSALSISTEDLVVLLANLLDNAIEACMKISERKEIVCHILYGDSLYISIRNTSLPVKIIDGEMASDKAGKVEHGYGIPAIRLILDRLNAEYTFEFNNGWFQFVADIPIE